MKAKVVVIGAGAVGLFCALRLAERGAQVTLIDGDAEDWSSRACSASRAAAGMLAPVSEAQLEPESVPPHAFELAWRSLQLWRDAPDWLKPNVRFPGALLLGVGAAPSGVETQSLTYAEIEARFGLTTAHDGVFVPDEGVVDPLPAMQAIVTQIRMLGGAVHFEMEAEAIDAKPWRRVRCFGGAAFTADFVVLSPGMWARDTLCDIAPALKLLRPAKGVLAPARLARDLAVTIRGPNFYLAPRAPGDVVLGSTMEFDVMDRRADPAKVAALLAAAQAALPDFVELSDAPAWAGVRPMSPDWSPLVGPNGAEGVLVACGHSRNGWLNAPITAEMICAYVLGDEIPPLWAAFAPGRFERLDDDKH
ncbi:MAG: FAD-dependent oxidoreductase [Alphaproteobacteria bacterium]